MRAIVTGVASDICRAAAFRQATARPHRIGLDEIGRVELNEALAAQALAVLRAWGREENADFRARFNPVGSGIALGHPIGATGGRIMATLLHGMPRGGIRYGLETMCVGGGQGVAALFELARPG